MFSYIAGPSFTKGRKSKRKRRRDLHEFCVLLDIVTYVWRGFTSDSTCAV